ncbi:MAG: hypothetical protein MK009_05865 [Gammaproteobacteria bacterium]|nr:hypothetical protein [Gammaproteobacteria bacterium]
MTRSREVLLLPSPHPITNPARYPIDNKTKQETSSTMLVCLPVIPRTHTREQST